MRPKNSSLLRVLRLAVVAALSLASFKSRAEDWPQWRGPNRDGQADERHLLHGWPRGGPTVLWNITNAGSGYGSPVVVERRVYLLGNDGVENESVRAFSASDGHLLWVARLGKVGNPEQQPSFPGARSTPTVVDDCLYALGSDGDLACVELKTGKFVWRKNLRTDFHGVPGMWAYSESPLVSGDTLVVTPGGSEATVVALNRKTGDVIWKAAMPEAGSAAYASAIMLCTGKAKLYVQFLQNGLVGLDTETGKLLWRNTKVVSRYGANIPTPVSGYDLIYAAGGGTGGGAFRLNMQDGILDPEPAYFDARFPAMSGGVVRVGNLLFGTGAKSLFCIEFKTGKVKWEHPSIGASSIIYADGQLILHGENGEVAMVVPSPQRYFETGRFTPTDQPEKLDPMEKAWAHPVVSDGYLFIRDSGSLWCYDVRDPNARK